MAVDLEERRFRLRELCSTLLSDRRLILASNRGPVEHQITPDGRTEARRGSGGVVTALSSLAQMVEFTWVASAIGEGDRKVSESSEGGRVRSSLPGHQIYLRYVVTPRRVYHKYYNVFCNPLLWFLQHYMWNSPYNPNLDANVHDAWLDGYVGVNKAFAEAVISESRGDTTPPIVMVHDYHLYLAPEYIRAALPGSVIHHFTHIPWPSPRYWQLLPSHMIRSMCSALCASDIVGFQTIHDVRNFLDTCRGIAAPKRGRPLQEGSALWRPAHPGSGLSHLYQRRGDKTHRHLPQGAGLRNQAAVSLQRAHHHPGRPGGAQQERGEGL